MVREQDAIELQAGYRQAGADCSIVVPNRIPYPEGEVENFIAVFFLPRKHQAPKGRPDHLQDLVGIFPYPSFRCAEASLRKSHDIPENISSEYPFSTA